MAAEAMRSGGRLGPYELIAPIGAGGMGEVWKARDTRLARVVAVKFSHAQFTERFEREARAIAALNHPNIAQIYDVGENYIVMEYVEGEPVRAPDNIRKLLDIAVQIADGLAAAHLAGFVHRDLKPDNILINKAGRVKILDFGIAKTTLAEPSEATRTIAITSPGTIVGTAAYMSPEQARGQELDGRSDQFSFGLVLYELATGRRAFQRPSAPETLAAIIRDDAEPLPSSVPTVLRWILERLLSKDPDDRYASTKDLLADLRGARTRMSGTMTAVAPARQRFALRPLLIGGLAVLGCIAAALPFLRSREVAALEPEYTPFATDACRERQPAWSPDARSLAYVCDVDGVDQIFTRALDSISSAQLTQATLPVANPFWSPDGSRVYFQHGNDIYFVGAAGGVPQPFIREAAFGAFSPDGRRLAFFRRSEGALYLAKGDGSDAVRYRRKGFPETSRTVVSRFSPDGKRLAMLSLSRRGAEDDRELWVADANGDNPVPSPAKFPEYTIAQGAFDWTPDGKRVLISSRSSESGEPHVHAVDVATGQQRALTAGPLNERDPAVSPDGTRVAVSVQTLTLSIHEFSLETGRSRPVVEGDRLDFCAAWHPSGREFAFVSDIAGRMTVSLRAGHDTTSRPLSLSGPPIRNIRRLAFSPDGQRLALDSYDREHRVLIVSSAGGVPIELDRKHKDSHGASFSPDGAWAVYSYFAQDGARVAKVSTSGGESVEIARRRNPTPGFQVSWSPAGDWIAFADDDIRQGLRLVSPDGKTENPLRGATYRAWTFDRDGKRICGFHRGDSRLWEFWCTDIASGASRRVVALDTPRDKTLLNPSLHPDGKRFLATVETDKSDIWTIEGITGK